MEATHRHFWERYLRTLPEDERPRSPGVVACMSGNEAVADELLQLYLEGRKHAGSSLVAEFVAEAEPLPKVGDYWIILNAAKEPSCIVRTTRVERHRFKDVTAEIARAEGEGDLSRSAWREIHRTFYEPHLERLGIADIEEAEVITEFFVRLYPVESSRKEG